MTTEHTAPPLPEPLDGPAVETCIAALVERATAEQWPLPDAPLPRFQRQQHQLHQLLRAHALGWLHARMQRQDVLPVVLTPDEMRAALGCEYHVFYQWLELGVLPGAQLVPGGHWRCTTAAFVGWLTLDRYWFGASPVVPS